ncbi:MAG: hypothetical protein EZS28_040192 [Streblomastix strix]|uniref:Uncharacterized protein n=1 Tax=Streblomastix strix TaxID=222440 RepID=A0A5J4U2P3_9EUKA|nr:MAG: hypothetical protein EZS28_040192 [Streblomastix strix]
MEQMKSRRLRADEDTKKIKKEIDELNTQQHREKNEGNLILNNIQQLNLQLNDIKSEIEKNQAERIQVVDSKLKEEQDQIREKDCVAEMRTEYQSIQKEIAEKRKQVFATLAKVKDTKRQKRQTFNLFENV